MEVVIFWMLNRSAFVSSMIVETEDELLEITLKCV